MNIYNNTTKIQKWRYSVKEIHLLIQGQNPYTIPAERVNSMTILNDFEKNVFPIFRIEIVLEPSVYYKIIKSKDTVRFHLNIEKYYHYNDNELSSLRRSCINDTFELILDDDNEDMLSATKRSEASNNFESMYNDDTNDLRLVDNKIEFFLYKADVIKGLKNIVNSILVNATRADAIAYILSVAGVKNVLMSNPETNESIPNLIIPPMPCLRALRFIDTYYGLYKNGSLMYFGLDYSYIIPYEGKCTAYRKNEPTTVNIIIPKDTSSHSTECGVLKNINDENTYIVGDYKTIAIRNDSITNDILGANDIEVVNEYSGNVNKETSNGISKRNNSLRILRNKTENPWIGTMYTAQTSSVGTVIEVALRDFDINIMTPNKKYNFLFEDSQLTSKYNGEYLLSYINFNLTQNGADVSVDSIAVFKKTK